MALRSKTIEYPFYQLTGSALSSSNAYQSEQRIIYVSETGSRTFTNVFADVYWKDGVALTTGRPSVVYQTLKFQLGNNNYLVSNISGSLPDSGEHLNYEGYYDLTDYFNSNFTSNSSQSCNFIFDYTSSGGGYSINGLGTKLYITYTYDDTNTTTRSKTVEIPLSNTSSLTTTHRELDKLPILNTYCPESGKTFDCVWVEFEGNHCLPTTTTAIITRSLDNDPTSISFTNLNTTAAGTWNKMLWELTGLDTSVTHSVKMSATTTGFHYNALTLKATYRYDHDSSNLILNSVYVPFSQESQIFDYLDPSEQYSWANFIVQEPSPIVPQNCAIRNYYTQGGVQTIYVFLNYSSSLNAVPFIFTSGGSSLEASSQIFQYRIDPSGSQNLFGTNNTCSVVRGINNYRHSVKSINFNRTATLNGYYILNYWSGKHSLGDGVHNHTLSEFTFSSSFLPEKSAVGTIAYGASNIRPSTIPETYYYLNNLSYLYNAFTTPPQNLGPQSQITFLVYTGSDGNLQRHGSEISKVTSITADAEISTYYYVVDFSDDFNKFPGSFAYKCNPKTTKLMVTNNQKSAVKTITTYHGITYAVSGSISGYSGDGSGIMVECIESGSDYNNEGKIFRTTTVVGGGFTGSVYNNFKQYYVTARQDSTRVGRSNPNTGSGA